MRIHYILLAVAGCTTTSSSGIATGDLFIDYQVLRHADAATAQATFHVGGGNTGTFVELDSADTIACDDVALAVTTSVVGQVWYQAAVPVVATPFVFALRRASGETDVTVPAPAAMVMTSPPASTMVAASTPVTATWTPSTGSATITASINVMSGSCTSAIVASDLPDTGTATIDLSSVAPTDGAPCAAELVLTRATSVAAGAPFEGGNLISSAFDSAVIAIDDD
jgi:hypothetical protein